MIFPGARRAFAIASLWMLLTAASASPPELLWSRYRQADFFNLRDTLPAPAANDSDDVIFLRAATLTAFAHPDASARMLEQLLSHPLANPALHVEARELLMLNRRSMFQYSAALDAIAPLLRGTALEDGRLRNLENRARLLRAIANIAPQRTTMGNGTPLATDGRGQIAVAIGSKIVRMPIDTGANLSVMPRHVAQMLGLNIRPANYSVGSPVGGRVAADVAVADLAFADGTRVRNAVFLVLPDSALPVALLGFPVISALGSIEYSHGAIVFGSRAKNESVGTPLALSGNDLLLNAVYAEEKILCRVDSGSARSVFYAPFYRRFGGGIASSDRRALRIGAATGTHRLNARTVSSLTIAVAGRAFRLSSATLLPEPVQGVPNPSLFCNIGRDILNRARFYRIDFTRMALTFGE